MAKPRVSLLRYITSAQKGWRRVRVEVIPKGRGWNKDWDSPKTYGPDCEEVAPYQLKWCTTGGKGRYARVGSDLLSSFSNTELYPSGETTVSPAESMWFRRTGTFDLSGPISAVP
jgi:hypothetical protein